MTLILSVITPFFAAQVSDRLVTRGAKPFNHYANKNVVYFAKDGIVSFGYSGPAYRGRHQASTDAWIAAVLAGEPEPSAPKPSGIRFRTGAAASEARTIDETLSLLKEALVTSAQFLPAGSRSMGFELVGCGWRQSGDASLPFLCGVADVEGTHEFEIETFEALKPGKLSLSVTPRRFNETCDRFMLAEGIGKAKTEDGLVGLLIEKVQLISRSVPQVGQDCMTIVIPEPPKEEVRVRFSPLNTQVGNFIDKRGVAVGPGFPVAFSPWIVTPGIEHEPQVFLGDYELVAGSWTVRMSAPYNPTSGIDFAMSSQPRVPSP